MANSPFDSINRFMGRGGNPQQILPMLMQKNPRFNQVMAQIDNMAQGRGYKDLALQLAKQKGIDVGQVQDLVNRMQGN